MYEGLEEFTAELTTTDSGVDIFQPDATARISDDDGKAKLYMHDDMQTFLVFSFTLQSSPFSSAPPPTLWLRVALFSWWYRKLAQQMKQ